MESILEPVPEILPAGVGVAQGVIQAIRIPVKSFLLVYPRLFNDQVFHFFSKERNCLQYTNFLLSAEAFSIEGI